MTQWTTNKSQHIDFQKLLSNDHNMFNTKEIKKIQPLMKKKKDTLKKKTTSITNWMHN